MERIDIVTGFGGEHDVLKESVSGCSPRSSIGTAVVHLKLFTSLTNF